MAEMKERGRKQEEKKVNKDKKSVRAADNAGVVQHGATGQLEEMLVLG